MDTSTRQEENAGIAMIAVLEDSERVQFITGRKKIACDEFSMGEWVAIVQLALIDARPYLKYVPDFLPAHGNVINIFKVINHSDEISNIGVHVCEKSFGHISQYNSITTSNFLRTEKVVIICEVSLPNNTESSGMIMLTNKAELFMVECKYYKLPDEPKFPVIVEANPLRWDAALIGLIFNTYKQVGPLTSLVLSYLLNGNGQRKIDQGQKMVSAGGKIGSYLNAIDFGNGIKLDFPWGYSGGAKKQ